MAQVKFELDAEAAGAIAAFDQLKKSIDKAERGLHKLQGKSDETKSAMSSLGKQVSNTLAGYASVGAALAGLQMIYNKLMEINRATVTAQQGWAQILGSSGDLGKGRQIDAALKQMQAAGVSLEQRRKLFGQVSAESPTADLQRRLALTEQAARLSIIHGEGAAKTVGTLGDLKGKSAGQIGDIAALIMGSAGGGAKMFQEEMGGKMLGRASAAGLDSDTAVALMLSAARSDEGGKVAGGLFEALTGTAEGKTRGFKGKSAAERLRELQNNPAMIEQIFGGQRLGVEQIMGGYGQALQDVQTAQASGRATADIRAGVQDMGNMARRRQILEAATADREMSAGEGGISGWLGDKAAELKLGTAAVLSGTAGNSETAITATIKENTKAIRDTRRDNAMHVNSINE